MEKQVGVNSFLIHCHNHFQKNCPKFTVWTGYIPHRDTPPLWIQLKTSPSRKLSILLLSDDEVIDTDLMLTMTSFLLSADTMAPSTRCLTAVSVRTLGFALENQRKTFKFTARRSVTFFLCRDKNSFQIHVNSRTPWSFVRQLVIPY